MEILLDSSIFFVDAMFAVDVFLSVDHGFGNQNRRSKVCSLVCNIGAEWAQI